MSGLGAPIARKAAPWYFKNSFVFLMLFIFGPLALPLVWWSPKFSKHWKITVTFLAIVLTILLVKTTSAMHRSLLAHLKEIQDASTI